MTQMLDKYLAVILSVLMVIAYLLFDWLVGTGPAKVTIDSLTLGVGLVIMYSWGSAAISAIRTGIRKDSSKIVLTIWLSWTVLVIQRIYVLIYTIIGKPDWLADSFFPGLITVLIFIAGMYAIVAPVQTDPTPRRQVISLVVSGVVAGLVAGIIIGFYYAKQISNF